MPRTPANITNGVVVDISLELALPEPVVRSTVSVYDGGEAVSIETRDDQPTAFGLSAEADTRAVPAMSPKYARLLRRMLPRRATMLWLRLTPPLGYLAAVPWEALWAHSRITVIRLPDQAALPARVGAYRHLVIVANAFSERRAMVAHINGFIASNRNRNPALEVDVFADKITVSQVEKAWWSDEHVVVHGPFDTAVAAGHEPGSGRIGSPIPIDGIRRRLHGRPVQGLHLVLPGGFDGDNPKLVAHQDLDDTLPPLYVDVSDVSELAGAVGAPLVSLASLTPETETAVRMVADIIGATRPGPTVFGRGRTRRATTALAAAQFGVAGEVVDRSQLPRGSGVFIYLQPDSAFAEMVLDAAGLPKPLAVRIYDHLKLTTLTSLQKLPVRLRVSLPGSIAGPTLRWDFDPEARSTIAHDAYARYDTELWAASASRYVEASRADLTAHQNASEPHAFNAYQQGAEKALDEIEALIADEGELFE